MAVPESIEDERAHLDSATTIVEPRLSKLGNHRSAGHRSPGPGPAHGLDNSEAGPKAVISPTMRPSLARLKKARLGPAWGLRLGLAQH